MEKSTTLNLRVNPTVKQQAEAVLAELYEQWEALSSQQEEQS